MTPEQLVGWVLRNDDAVAALVAGRVYPLVVPQQVSRPAIAYQRISGPRTYSHSGPTLAFARFQITCEGTTYAEACRVAAVVRVALERNGWQVANESDGYSELYAAPVKRMDVTQDYEE